MKYNTEFNLNTILQSVIIAVMSYIGFVAVQAKDDITKLSVQQAYLVKAVDDVMPRIETELKLGALKAQIEELQREVTAMKRLLQPKA